VAAVASVGGCDGDSRPRLTKADYRQQELRFAEQYAAADHFYLNFVTKRLRRGKCAKEVRRYQRAIERMVTDAEALRPPAEIEGLHRQLVSAGQEMLDEIERAARDVASGRLSCGQQALNRRIYGAYSASPIDRILLSLERRGYLFPND
jgi:hypothetical protein